MIDIHNHLLPGLDDGPATIEESIESAARSAADGVTAVAATPHLREDHPNVRPDMLAERRQELCERLQGAGVPLEVVTGGEVDIAWAQTASDRDLRLVSYSQLGRDLLVETPYGHLPGTFEDLLFRLQVRGYRVTLAHPERNPSFQSESTRLSALVERGLLVQLTASALTAPPERSRSGRLAQRLLDEGLAHVIASDSHGSSAARSALSEAVAVARGRVGERALWMVTAAPEAILAGEPLIPWARPRSTRRRLPFRR